MSHASEFSQARDAYDAAISAWQQAEKKMHEANSARRKNVSAASKEEASRALSDACADATQRLLATQTAFHVTRQKTINAHFADLKATGTSLKVVADATAIADADVLSASRAAAAALKEAAAAALNATPDALDNLKVAADANKVALDTLKTAAAASRVASFAFKVIVAAGKKRAAEAERTTTAKRAAAAKPHSTYPSPCHSDGEL